VSLLAEGGVLEVAGEQRMRGFIERSYRLRPEQAVIDAATASSATLDDHGRIFGMAMAVLLAEFTAYLDRPDADPAADLVGYRQHTVWLSPQERAALITDLRKVIAPRLANEPSADRRPHLISPILFPTE
jgi:hypothetical protein